jgi:ADP-heptose:LPS heptosyltransferase
MKLQQELALISNLDVMVSMDSGNAHIAAMLGVKLSHFGVLRILMPVFTVPSAFRKYFGFRQEYPMLPTSVYGNKIVVGYEDAMRTITQEMVVMSVQKQLED